MNTKKSQSGRVIIVLLGIIIFAGALFSARYFIKNKPVAEKKAKIVKTVPIVETITLKPIDHQINIIAMGNVVAARKINVVSQVKGEVISTHHNFLPGGIIHKGETLLKINPIDYELVKLQKVSDVEKAKNDLTIEMGKQSVAKKEYSLLGADLAIKDQALILRKPQLSLKQANLTSAQARLKQSELNLKRTHIKAPFNALIESKKVEKGSWQNVGSTLVSLIDTDQYWIDVNLPIDRLALISVPEFNAKKGSTALVKYSAAWGNKTRVAKVKRLQPNIDSKVRMAQLIVEVDDPLSFKKANKSQPKLLIGSFVEVNLLGKVLKEVLAVPRRALRDGGQLWLLNEEDKLQIETVTVLWKNQKSIYIDAKSIVKGAKIIITELSSPIPSMQLNTKKNEDE